MPWPPLFEDLKDDVALVDPEDEAALQRRLNASVSFVQRKRRDAFVTDDCGELIDPIELSAKGERELDSLELGTFMLAHRLFARRRSPDQVFWMSETGTTRIAFGDPDIMRQLGLHKPKVG